MNKNAVVNGLVAEVYIVVLVLIMNWGTGLVAGKGDTLVAPIAMISIFTLSAAVMGYLFCYTPIVLFLEGKKKQGVQVFLQTVGVFGVLTAVAMSAFFLRIFS